MSRIDFGPFFKGEKAIARSAKIQLESGSRVAVMGGGPAGSFFSYFLLTLAERVGLDLQLDIYEPRDFNLAGPPGCNMCAGIVSETLIQALAVDGINLPTSVIQRGMDSYVLHNDVGTVQLETPNLEKRIGAIFRGVGPKGITDSEQASFDGFLLNQAVEKGANHICKRVDGIKRHDGRLRISTRGEADQDYDFLAVATGVNTSALRLFEPLGISYRPPRLARTFIREYYLGRDVVQEYFGQTAHFFLLDLPGLQFAAIVPKSCSVTICLLGQDLSPELFEAFLDTPQVKTCMPDGWLASEYACHCCPRINLSGAIDPFAERIVFVGDSGISRLYKDGIGAAYRAAKAAATAAIFSGIGEADLRYSYGRSSQMMEYDNRVGKFIFAVVDLIKPYRFVGRALLQMVESEQLRPASQRRMSDVVWDLFTGSAPYRDVLYRMLNPATGCWLLWYMGVALVRRSER